MVSNLNEMARKMSKLSGQIVRNDTADLGGEPLGGFATSRSSRRVSSGHVRGASCTWMHSKRGSLGVVIGFEQIQ